MLLSTSIIGQTTGNVVWQRSKYEKDALYGPTQRVLYRSIQSSVAGGRG